MATSRRGLVDRVKTVAAEAGAKGARVVVETASATVRKVDALQSRLRGARRKGEDAVEAARTRATQVIDRATQVVNEKAPGLVAAAGARRKRAAESRRAAVSPRGVVESAQPVKATKSATAEAPEREMGRKTVPARAAASRRATSRATPSEKAAPVSAAAPKVKVKRGQKHRHRH